MFLGCEHQIWHLELLSLNRPPSIWGMYQFSWRVPTVPLAFDVDVTICKPFYLWKKQSKESGPDRLVLGSELQTDFYLWNGLNLITGTVIQAMFPGWAGDRPAVLLALRAHMGMRAHSCTHNPPPTHSYSLRENAISTIVTGEPQSGDIFCKGPREEKWGRLRGWQRRGISRSNMNLL